MTPSQQAMRQVNALLLSDGWDTINELLYGRVYLRGKSILVLANQRPDVFTAT